MRDTPGCVVLHPTGRCHRPEQRCVSGFACTDMCLASLKRIVIHRVVLLLSVFFVFCHFYFSIILPGQCSSSTYCLYYLVLILIPVATRERESHEAHLSTSSSLRSSCSSWLNHTRGVPSRLLSPRISASVTSMISTTTTVASI